jgi:hypothetical protein
MTEKTAPGAEAPKKATRFDVKLLVPHTHAGKEHEAGATINVTARQRTFLVESKVIAPEAK